MTAIEHRTEMRKLASDLFKNEDGLQCDRSHGEQCLAHEDKRPLTVAERKNGWVRRPFSAYDPDRLCLSCRAYFFTEMAAQTLERLTMIESVKNR